MIKFLKSIFPRFQNENAPTAPPHPLDGCDPNDLHKMMMDERKELIKAVRDSHDGMVKAIVTTASAMLTLISGFIAQNSQSISPDILSYAGYSILFLILSIILSLFENEFSGVANDKQRQNVEDYYCKKVATISVPWQNHAVHWCRRFSFAAFVTALFILGFFAYCQSKDKLHGKLTAATSSATSSATTSSSATSSSAATSASNLRR